MSKTIAPFSSAVSDFVKTVKTTIPKDYISKKGVIDLNKIKSNPCFYYNDNAFEIAVLEALDTIDGIDGKIKPSTWIPAKSTTSDLGFAKKIKQYAGTQQKILRKRLREVARNTEEYTNLRARNFQISLLKISASEYIKVKGTPRKTDDPLAIEAFKKNLKFETRCQVI